MTALLVETTDLTKRYGPRAAVDRVGLRVRRGEVYGFLGPNGAGKTPTLRMLLGLVRASSGTARVLGTAPARGTSNHGRRAGRRRRQRHRRPVTRRWPARAVVGLASQAGREIMLLAHAHQPGASIPAAWAAAVAGTHCCMHPLGYRPAAATASTPSPRSGDAPRPLPAPTVLAGPTIPGPGRPGRSPRPGRPRAGRTRASTWRV
jgi:energy-coupling factor transporter ATP-binding protein EcfA2